MKFIRAFPTNRKVWVEDWAYDRVRWIHWSDDGKKIKAKINGKTTSMARYLKNVTDPNYVVDHIDGNYCNNLDSNLRVSTYAENSRNQKPDKHKNMGSKFLGTTYRYKLKKWEADIKVNGSQIYLGTFDIEEEAARAYDEAAKKYYGEFARLNFPCQPFSVTRTSTG